jgi:deoxyribodipyrimidine photolyase
MDKGMIQQNEPFNLHSLVCNNTLRERIHVKMNCKTNPNNSFVLYIPTVTLRKRHNPAFTFACQIANHHQVPVVVLALVIDDSFHPVFREAQPKRIHDSVVFTARKTAFVLEALQQASREWSDHGAGVAIRVYGPGNRTPHHLTLSSNAVAVVTDEPFVNPYLSLVRSIERGVMNLQIPVVRVDGSTTVAPMAILSSGNQESNLQSLTPHSTHTTFTKPPTKAWIWEKQTDSKRRAHVLGVVQERHFDAPPLIHKLPINFFRKKDIVLALNLPSLWMDPNSPCPGKRPWTVEELEEIQDLKDWVQKWPGMDNSVLPCSQTHGSSAAGMQRWTRFRQKHLSQYAKLRNDITKPHAVSRMSCYLNLGCVSIFDVVNDMWNSGHPSGSKFSDEVVKWREIGYAHAFANPDAYATSEAIPPWALSYLRSKLQSNNFDKSRDDNNLLLLLESAQSSDPTWNAMQEYLISTGELHNNARMTWGKTILHWLKTSLGVDDLLSYLIFLNDRYALDGLAPPSYAGILWCFGWGDKPVATNNVNAIKAISQKSSSIYRKKASDFEEARRALLMSSIDVKSIATCFPGTKQLTMRSLGRNKRPAAIDTDDGNDMTSKKPAIDKLNQSEKVVSDVTKSPSPSQESLETIIHLNKDQSNKSSILSYFGHLKSMG